MAPVVGGAALYGSHVQDELTSAAATAKAELEAAVNAHRIDLNAAFEAQLTHLRAESQQLREQLVHTGEELREVGRTMVERVEAASFEARDQLHRISAQLKGEGDERLEVLEDHLRTALERVRVEVEQATFEAVARVRQTAERDALAQPGIDATLPTDRLASDPSFFLSPEQADDDDIDLG